MPDTAAVIAWTVLCAYATIGALVAILLFIFGLRRMDGAAAKAPWRVKVLITPGIIAVWPLLIPRIFGAKPREDRS